MDFFKKILECKLDTSDFYNCIFHWLKGTENILNQVLNSFDKKANAIIIPALDIGLSNYVRKVAGGFLSGCYVEWQCSIPFIPIDANINVCTSGVFKLKDDINSVSFKKFQDKVLHMFHNRNGYNWDFDSSNHFILLAEDSNCGYLILHSSPVSKNYLDTGLHPVKGNWYWNDIKIFYNSDRYLRYISNKTAERFWEIVKTIPDYNENCHNFFADFFVEGFTSIDEKYIIHHYGMPDRQSINIGCFLVKPNSVVPIFSAPGKNIFLYKVDEKDPEIRNRKLIPHGWGKSFSNLKTLSLENDYKYLCLGNIKYLIDSDEMIKGSYRLYSDNPMEKNFYFNKTSKYLYGEIYKIIKQVYTYSSKGFSSWKHMG